MHRDCFTPQPLQPITSQQATKATRTCMHISAGCLSSVRPCAYQVLTQSEGWESSAVMPQGTEIFSTSPHPTLQVSAAASASARKLKPECQKRVLALDGRMQNRSCLYLRQQGTTVSFNLCLGQAYACTLLLHLLPGSGARATQKVTRQTA